MSTTTPLHGASQATRVLRHTKIPTRVFRFSEDAARHVALMIENLIRERSSAGLPVVLGLPTGSTPVGVYRELVRLHRDEDLDFSNVVTFNLDEYYPMQSDALQSYNRWMRENFFDHVNIPPEQIHIPDGTLATEEVDEQCARYEQRIERAGGIDLQLLGIGRTGHIGFNEPGSTRDSRTRMVTLDPVTAKDAAGDFFGEENVPRHAITMGVGTILDARKVVIMALGEHKAPVVRAAIEGEVTPKITASYLQKHPDCVFILDEAASGELTAVKAPWLTGPVSWTPPLIRRAVIWLSFQEKKALLKLEDADFREHNLHDLVEEHGPAAKLCQQVFDEMMATICTAPAGTDPQRVLCFSPHPDDDVISMGGMLLRFVDQGHEAHVAYLTSGNIAVFDHDAMRFADFVAEYNAMLGIENEKTAELEERVQRFLAEKRPGQLDTSAVLSIKTLIRKTEARAAANSIGIPEEHLHFLDLPFYQTGTVAKRPISEDDVARVRELLEELRPVEVYVAGDLSDPHGTHRMCAEAIFLALDQMRSDGYDPEVWLYRGAWQEWEPHEIDRAIPLAPHEMQRKKAAIFRHESQKDAALYPGPVDTREFWQRAEDRNRGTAKLYDQLGLPEYFALEGFVRWRSE